MLLAYADLIDGLRSYYAKREGDDWAAAFNAAMAAAVLFILNLSAVVMLVDLLINHDLKLVSWLTANRIVLVIISVTIAALHVCFAKLTGVYDRHGGPRNPSWASHLRAYITVTVCTCVLSIVAILAMRNSGG